MSAPDVCTNLVCPKCGGALREAAKFRGLLCCTTEGCKGVKLTPQGAREMHEELCRKCGMTADEIVADWNKRSPEDEW